VHEQDGGCCRDASLIAHARMAPHPHGGRVMKPSAFIIRITCASALLLAALPAAAQWTGKGEAGLAIADGNSNSRTANARVTAARKVDAWEHSLGLGGLYVRSDGDTTAKRWEATAQTRFDFLPNTFWYGGGR